MLLTVSASLPHRRAILHRDRRDLHIPDPQHPVALALAYTCSLRLHVLSIPPSSGLAWFSVGLLQRVLAAGMLWTSFRWALIGLRLSHYSGGLGLVWVLFGWVCAGVESQSSVRGL